MVTRQLRSTAVLAIVLLSMVIATPAAHADDDVRGLSWHLDAFKISQVHRVSQGEGVVVAVVDTGVNANHRDLRGQVLPGRGFGPAAGTDGRTDVDAAGSHGTSMASIIAGKGGGSGHMLGIAPKARILPVNAGAGSSGAGSEALVEAVRWATAQKPDVLNLSIGTDATGTPDPELLAAIAEAVRQDIVVVAGAGNSGADVADTAKVPGVISVNAVDSRNEVSPLTNHGPSLAIAAPGAKIPVAVNRGATNYAYITDAATSPATAMVSGVAALVRARYPDLDAANVVNRLVETATDRGPKGRDESYGFGVVNPLAALTAEVPTVDENPLGTPAAATTAPATDPAVAADEDDTGFPTLLIAIATAAVVILALLVLGAVLLLRRRSVSGR
ncbi:S8 family serine peptidase [Asanoa sp. WMMD1127]|uniref:S8 family serine peptidase n=1 Tax=Asanoa sp. WMMD1127 TaxID=3016107 RepID=UPI002416E2D1|nr:S8 family serine peptidase [Asanoa sp. WMMD1127]MDG4824635.1 S8 family serine peptidase [Asanoa sp. WMMD1127]